jgi:hypothetical protein
MLSQVKFHSVIKPPPPSWFGGNLPSSQNQNAAGCSEDQLRRLLSGYQGLINHL